MLDRHLLIVTGKGGVGRSALAASLALRAARGGRRVLAVTMTDSLGLSGHLRTGTLGPKPIEARPGLSAMAIEPAAALDEYLRIRLRVPRVGAMTRAFRVLAETVPGIRDTVVIGKLLWEAARSDWDLVVADGPPTGQVLSLLRAPSTIEGLVPASRVKAQAAWMRRMLADGAGTGIVVAATPEELPVAEAAETIAALSEEGLAAVAAVVANRVLPELRIDRGLLDAEPPGPRRDAALLHLDIAAGQRRHVAGLHPDHILPLLFGIRTPGEVASRLADLWELA
ncbi:MAG: ArsA-related P-loop ATPase [Actinomycetota bacterium]